MGLVPSAGADEPPSIETAHDTPAHHLKAPPDPATLTHLASARGTPAALTLADCYALALARSETIAIHQEQLKETEGRVRRALGEALPSVSFSSSDKEQDGTGTSSFTLKHVPERKFVFTQPLFSGFREFAAMTGARAERRERREESARAAQLLFVDVSDAFYLLREQREDLRALEVIRTALVERVDELHDRERLGRSRPSEAISVEAQLRRLHAEIERVRNQDTVARQLLEFLTGVEPIDALIDPEPLPSTAMSDTIPMSQANARPDVKAAEAAWQIAQQAVRVARADLWPDVDLEANYYTKRVGVAADIDWDALLKINVPLFQGGRAMGAISESRSRERQAKLRFEQVQREALLDIRHADANFHSALARHAALTDALAAAEENYRLQTQDYRLSLVNNLEVLQALQALEDTRRDVIHSTYEVKRLYQRLRVATGEPL